MHIFIFAVTALVHPNYSKKINDSNLLLKKISWEMAVEAFETRWNRAPNLECQMALNERAKFLRLILLQISVMTSQLRGPQK